MGRDGFQKKVKVLEGSQVVVSASCEHLSEIGALLPVDVHLETQHHCEQNQVLANGQPELGFVRNRFKFVNRELLSYAPVSFVGGIQKRLHHAEN